MEIVLIICKLNERKKDREIICSTRRKEEMAYCKDWSYEEDYPTMVHNHHKYFSYPMTCLQVVLVGGSLYWVFIQRKDIVKPAFLICIWVVVGLQTLLLAIHWAVYAFADP